MNMHISAPTPHSDHDELVAFCERMGDPLPKFLTMADLRRPYHEAPNFFEVQLSTWRQTGQMDPAPAESLMLVLSKRFLRRRAALNALIAQAQVLHRSAMAAARRADGALDLDDVDAIKATNGYVSVRDECRRVERELFRAARRILRYHPASALGLALLKEVELFAFMFDRPSVWTRRSTTAAV
ncbi:hypothetical protein LGR54_24720 [Ancylobacter sp. Lp-2]|uniref:hypothetical protein n=1 Tax=Ancylobacter sp. Lp-2 TaxID=2881339 RepID=UPI001E62C5A3|nr:hypothetical protein [Ancylobacter sp. Lp-2]MCB4771820.1 hypothetical protein [Ancylobacter sp. Lp-2]